MNCLHNYVVNDTPSFISQPDRLEIVFEMCKHVSDRRADDTIEPSLSRFCAQVIVNDLGEDSEAHAAKLLEVVILQCQDSTSVVRIQFEWTPALFASLIVLLLLL